MEQAEEDTTVTLRGERIELHETISSVYNHSHCQLLVVTPSTLYLYDELLTAGGDLVATLSAPKNVLYQFALLLPWLDAYSVISTNASGAIEHRIVSSDLKTSWTSHTLVDKGGEFYTALINPHRRELLTADSDGGLKVWTLRVMTSTPTNGQLKGVLRLHTAASSTKRPHYRHLGMSFDGKRVVAATSTKVYVLDAASCSRSLHCLRHDCDSICSMDCGSNDHSISLIFKANRRKVCHYTLLGRKGQVRKVGEYEHKREIAVFIANKQQPVHSTEAAHGIMIVDTCARFSTVGLGRRTQSAVTLPFNPLSERYVALHAAGQRNGRKFIFAVWSTGFCIVELFLSDSQCRIPCQVMNGERLKRVDGGGQGDSIAIYQRLPSLQIALFKEETRTFRLARLSNVAISNTMEGASENTLPLVDYVVAADAVIVLWRHGRVERYNWSDNRVVTIAQPFEAATTIASTMISVSFDGQDSVAVGDSMGDIRVFGLGNTDSTSRGLRTRKQAHANDSVSALVELSRNRATCVDASLLLLSVSRGGEVKCWRITRSSTVFAASKSESFVWKLLACFRTYASDVSTVAFEFPEFVFCGFDGGTIECWRLPCHDKAASKDLRSQTQGFHRICVAKRALHAIDLHMAPVLGIRSESGAGTSVLTKSSRAVDLFSWIVSYDKDAVILVWCFSLDLFFPHRRLKANNSIKGIYLSPAKDCLDLYAYIGHCIDRVDQLGAGDKEAVRQRLQRGRALSAQRKLKTQAAEGGQLPAAQSHGADTGTDSISNAELTSCDRSSLTKSSSLVQINILMPVFKHKASSPCKESTKAIVELSKAAPTSPTDKQDVANDAPAEADRAQMAPSSSTTRMLDQPLSKSMASSLDQSLSCHFTRSVQHIRDKKKEAHTRKALHAVQYLPRVNSLPSSFQQAKPRVYRKEINPLESLSSQGRCAVVTAGSAYATSSFSSFEKEDGPEVSDVADVSISTRAAHCGLQEKVSVVSLVEAEDESILLLDYQPGSRRPIASLSRKPSAEESQDKLQAAYEIPFLPWSRMSDVDRRVELMAASKSKSIQENADKDDVVVPCVDDFASVKTAMQTRVRLFTRWFIAARDHHQRVRERFLTEELSFAAIDPVIHEELAHVGLPQPPVEEMGLLTSTAWQEFVTWYCLGLTRRQQTNIPLEVLQRDRFKARTEYLKLRLHMVAQAELEVQQEEEAAGPCEEACEPPQRVFIFEHFVKRLLSDKDSPTSWDKTSFENQQKELVVALMDPAVQVAAMRNDIELLDVSGFCMEDLNIVALANKFVLWWNKPRNVHRRDFLKREAHEAATSKKILALLSKELTGAAAIDTNDFGEAYFRSDTARGTFLNEKLFYLRRKNRIAGVTRYGSLPAPLVMETLPLPVVSSFEFVEREIVEEVDTEALIEAARDDAMLDERQEGEQLEVKSIDTQDENEEENLRRLEDEKAKMALELIVMAVEDELSHEFSRSFVESDGEVEESSPVVPKRTVFSQSYFFGNLPTHYRHVASSGWRVGSGADNGDEEHEEEIQFEREREHQRMLDEQEAARLMELERQAERARIDKEREERAFQVRRVRQTELKKVLMHQAELEAQRKADLEGARERQEQSRMQQEDEHSCWHRDQLLRDQSGMQLEDQLGSQVRKELHSAAVAQMWLLLDERSRMVVEDQRSLQVDKELRELNRVQAARTAFLSELYTPFHPYYQDSAAASESFLPRIQWRLKQRQPRLTPVQAAGGYTIPLEDALVMDELNQEPYRARDSRKFKILMGLPLRTSSSQKRPRVPNADAILAMQRRQRQLVEVTEERHEVLLDAGKTMVLPHRVRPHNDSSEQSRLPDIATKAQAFGSLTNLKEACRKQDAASPKPIKTNQHHQHNQHNQSLPFFRGNMLVQGHGQARSKDYAY